MTFEIIQGDLFVNNFNFDALAQGVNTQGIMGAGIAVPFKTKWPAMYKDYKYRCQTYGNALAGLTHVWRPWFDGHFIELPDGEVIEQYNAGPTIYNLFSQIMPGRNGDYRLLQSAAIAMVFDAEEQEHVNVGLPWIGCGIAGLERHNVEHILSAVFDPSPVHFVIVQQDPTHEPPTEEEWDSIRV
jgi:O-acetyl-ADP-ribose deacetylase (regulator of RNase III)